MIRELPKREFSLRVNVAAVATKWCLRSGPQRGPPEDLTALLDPSAVPAPPMAKSNLRLNAALYYIEPRPPLNTKPRPRGPALTTRLLGPTLLALANLMKRIQVMDARVFLLGWLFKLFNGR